MARKPRDYKKEYQQQKARKHEHKRRMERQDARRDFDEKHTGKRTTASPKRKGKDLAHNKALSKGGSNKDGVKLMSPSKNRSNNFSKGNPKKK